jgi:processive 1,2-diacylglycerol beta-glucosyltransferase
MPRVLILSASIGSGHVRAADALAKAVRRLRRDAVVRTADVLDFATAPLRFGYADVYLGLINRAPQVLGTIYGWFDRPVLPRYGPMYQLKVALERMNLRPLEDLLTTEPWDLVINTFFLSAEIIAALRRQGRFTAPQVQVITDFESHRNWVNHPVDLYCTATDEAALYLECFGVPRAAAVNTGIPIDPVFVVEKDQAMCQARHGLRTDRPVVLVLSGGYGVGPIEAIHRSVLDVRMPLQVVVVTGRNEAARRRLAAVPVGHHAAQVLGYTEQIDELFAAADLVVTKPGGLTTAEALARGVGMVIVNPVPGQEERNSDYLLENGAAIKVNHLPTLAHKLEAVLRDPAALDRLTANAKRLARPRAAFDVAERALRLIEDRTKPRELGDDGYASSSGISGKAVRRGSVLSPLPALRERG